MSAFPPQQKKANSKTGSEMQRDKEAVAALMRAKQAAGMFHILLASMPFPVSRGVTSSTPFD